MAQFFFFNLERLTERKATIREFKVLALRPWQITCVLRIAIILDEELQMKNRDVFPPGAWILVEEAK